jgi:hypothetical protein
MTLRQFSFAQARGLAGLAKATWLRGSLMLIPSAVNVLIMTRQSGEPKQDPLSMTTRLDVAMARKVQ